MVGDVCWCANDGADMLLFCFSLFDCTPRSGLKTAKTIIFVIRDTGIC